MNDDQEQTPMPSVFILGPSLDNVIEPIPVTVPTTDATPGRRQITFDAPPTTPGGNVHLLLLPPLNPGDVLPINVYAFFFAPVSAVPPAEARTPDFFFKSGAPNSSIHIGAADADGKFTIPVAGVKPSLEPYFVQTVLEFQS